MKAVGKKTCTGLPRTSNVQPKTTPSRLSRSQQVHGIPTLLVIRPLLSATKFGKAETEPLRKRLKVIEQQPTPSFQFRNNENGVRWQGLRSIAIKEEEEKVHRHIHDSTVQLIGSACASNFLEAATGVSEREDSGNDTATKLKPREDDPPECHFCLERCENAEALVSPGLQARPSRLQVSL